MAPSLKLSLFLILIINIILYLFIYKFHSLVPFNTLQYSQSAHHFFPDPRLSGNFSLLSSLAQYDAQWYLKIASLDYPFPTSPPSLANDDILTNSLAYAFFPLYPLIIRYLSFPGINLLNSAFLLSLVLIIINILSIWYVVSRLFSHITAQKTLLLIFTFPFGIFFRSYYTESLQLLLLTWFIYFLHRHKFLFASIFLSLLNVVKSNLWLLNVIFLIYVCKKSANLKNVLLYLPILLIPLSFWLYYNYLMTGSPIYFLSAFQVWYPKGVFYNYIKNLISIAQLARHYFHTIHSSQIEILSFLSIMSVFFFARKKIPLLYWFIGISIALTPLLTKDLASYSRYQSISLPFFISLSQITNHKSFTLLCLLFYSSLLITSLFFINWYWIG